MNRTPRRDRLMAALAELELSGFLVTNASNVRYLTGYTGSNGTVCLGTAARFLTDFRYATSVGHLAGEWEVEIVEQSLRKQLRGRAQFACVAAHFGAHGHGVGVAETLRRR